MKIALLYFFTTSAFALLPPTESDLKKVIDDPAEYKKIEKELMEPGQCGFFKNLEEDEEFKRAKVLLNNYDEAKKQIVDSQNSLDSLEEDEEIKRRKAGLDQAETEIRQMGCDQPRLFRQVIRLYKSMDGVLEALNKKETNLQLHIISEDTMPYEEAYAHYHDYRNSMLDQSTNSLSRAKKTIARIERDPLYKKLLSKYSKKKLEEFKNTPDFEPPKQIVINFEGTGGYSPKTAKRLKVLNSYTGVNRSDEMRKSAEDNIWNSHNDKNDFGLDTWPGMLHGAMTQSLTGINNKKDKNFKGHPNTQWLYYKSEDQQDSRNNAMNCLEIYLEKYKKKYKKDLPKVVVMGHSSGGFSAMKFANQLANKKMGVKINLVTIDPVVPYQAATVDGIARKINPFAKNRIGDHSDYGIFKVDSKKVTAHNYHQSQDVHGLIPTEQAKDIPILGEKLQKQGLGFGIHGSEVEGAKNKEIWFLSTSYEARGAHGAITLHKEVLDKIKAQFE